MKHPSFAILRVLAVAAVCAVSAAQSTAPALPKVAFEKFTLSNGLQTILHVDRKLPVVHVNMWFHVGSKNERVGRSGFAHLFEHMMFEGSKNAPTKYFAYAEKAGANLMEGGVNGTTDWDRTNYFITVPSANLEHILWLESDRVATLAEAVTDERLKNQRDVVRNERRQGLENQPYGRWIKLVMENVYPFRHPYANDVIGSHEDLIAATLEDVRDFFRTYYSPNNLTITIAGDFDPAEARKMVERYFGGIPAGPALDRPARWPVRLDSERVVEVRDRVPQERVYMAWPSPGFFERGDAELDVASLILTGGLESRLNKLLVYDKRLCSNVSSFQMTGEHSSVFVIQATARPGASLDEVEKLLTAEVSRLAKEGPGEAELARAKTKWEYQFVSGLERIGGFGGKADLLNRYNTFLGDPARLEADFARYRDATASAIRDTIAGVLDRPGRLIVRFRPETSGKPMQVTLDRSKPPAVGEDRPFRAPTVSSGRLENGIELLVVSRSDLPKVAVSFATRAGAADDTFAMAGLAALTADTMPLGTAARKALEISGAMGDLGTALQGFAAREHSGISMDVLKRNLSPAMAIFADVVRNPAFPESEFDLQKKRHLDALQQQARNASAVGMRVASMAAFGREHPYGTPDRGLPGTVGKFTRQDLVRFHQTYWKPASSALIFAGDISLAEATDLAKRHFGDWTGGPRPAISIPAPKPSAPGKVILVDRQDAPQTMIVQVLPAPPRRSDDYYALRLADGIWGGAAGARLGTNLREEKGYSYGVFSIPTLYTKAGMWRAYGTVQADKTRESVVEFEKELLFIAGEKPPTVEELAGAKANRVRGYAQQFESLQRIAQQVANLWAQSLPMSELDREPVELTKTGLDAVIAAAKKYAAPDRATLVLVGDLSKIEAGVRSAVKREVVVLDSEGNPR